MTSETKQYLKAFAAYFELDPKEVKFWINQVEANEGTAWGLKIKDETTTSDRAVADSGKRTVGIPKP